MRYDVGFKPANGQRMWITNVNPDSGDGYWHEPSELAAIAECIQDAIANCPEFWMDDAGVDLTNWSIRLRPAQGEQ